MWRGHMQTLVCMAACLTFFSSKVIARPEDVSNLLVSSFLPSLARHVITLNCSHTEIRFKYAT